MSFIYFVIVCVIYLAFEFGYLIGHNKGVDKMAEKIRLRIDSGYISGIAKSSVDGEDLKMPFWSEPDKRRRR